MFEYSSLIAIGLAALAAIILILAALGLVGCRYIPHNRVGVIEKLWSPKGSLKGGRIVASHEEAGFQTRLLRGGLHFGFYPFQFSVHKQPLITVAEGKIAYLYARDGQPLPPTQTLGKVVECNGFQDAAAFLENGGQRGRQRATLREGVYAINTALFVVITEDAVYGGPSQESDKETYKGWQDELKSCNGFSPVVIGFGRNNGHDLPPLPNEAEPDQILSATDQIGVVTVHDGLTLPSGEIIAPQVGGGGNDGHNYFQDTEKFISLGGFRGKQRQVLTDGTFFINRWFASVEMKPKYLIPIGSVGVVVSYYGKPGEDTTGTGFRYGEQVGTDERGVWKKALPPGKYALNPYAVKVEPVPTVNFVLRWITGVTESHRYDQDLRSIELVTSDGYEPLLPLSLVLHIDYERAPSVVQRFGNVKRLITQTLDPILTAFFRDVAQKNSMLDLLVKRETIQQQATEELGNRFKAYDINCIAVLIGRPESQKKGAPDDPIDRLFDQLRLRRLADEQKATYIRQEETATQLKALNEATAIAQKQAELTGTKIAIEIAKNKGAAELAEAEGLAKRDIARADGQSHAMELEGRGEASRVSQVGEAEAEVNRKKIAAYGEPRLFALNLLGEQLSKSVQPLVPERMFILGGGSGANGDQPAGGNALNGLLPALLSLLVAEKSGLALSSEKKGDNGDQPGADTKSAGESNN
jgi:uncharacterized membrane protein YqiK